MRRGNALERTEQNKGGKEEGRQEGRQKREIRKI